MYEVTPWFWVFFLALKSMHISAVPSLQQASALTWEHQIWQALWAERPAFLTAVFEPLHWVLARPRPAALLLLRPSSCLLHDCESFGWLFLCACWQSLLANCSRCMRVGDCSLAGRQPSCSSWTLSCGLSSLPCCLLALFCRLSRPLFCLSSVLCILSSSLVPLNCRPACRMIGAHSGSRSLLQFGSGEEVCFSGHRLCFSSLHRLSCSGCRRLCLGSLCLRRLFFGGLKRPCFRGLCFFQFWEVRLHSHGTWLDNA